MNTAFRALPADNGFARRSAQYLSANGYRPLQIRNALVHELDVTTATANEIVDSIAA